MKINSLGYRTDLFFPAFDGELIDRQNYLVIRTPNNPTFYWGQFLLFPDPPVHGDLARWRDLFTKEIGTQPEVKHQVFGWDSVSREVGVVQPFLDTGFRLNRLVVLMTHEVHPPQQRPVDIQIRPIQLEQEWQQVLAHQASWDPAITNRGGRALHDRHMARYHAMIERGLGLWFGAFDGSRLVADLGIFHDHKMGRYQLVGTHPDYRRRGIGGMLVFEAGRYALREFGLTALVIATDNAAARRMYQRVGFEPTEYQTGLEWWAGIEAPQDQGG